MLTPEQDIAQLKTLLEDSEVFIAVWAAHYAGTHGLQGWHEDHLAFFNKVRSATGRPELKAQDVNYDRPTLSDF